MTTTSSERRLHPLTVLFEAARWLPRMVLPLIVLMFTTRGQDGTLAFILFPIAGIAGILLLTSIVRYARYRYYYDDRDLVVRSGLLTRNERRIPYTRIQNLDASQNPLHRMLGVVAVYVQTGGGAEPEATLRVLPVAALDEMRARVLQAGGRTGTARSSVEPTSDAASSAMTDAGVTSRPDLTDSPASPVDRPGGWPAAEGPGILAAADRPDILPAGDRPADRAEPALVPARRTLLSLKPHDLIVAGFIENRGMVLIFGALALLEQTGVTTRIIEQMFETENEALAGVATRWLGGGDVPVVRGALYVLAAVLAILLFIRLLSTVWAVVRLYDFRLERVGDDLFTEYGLFTRVSATIPLRRVQTIIVRDSLLHRVLSRRMVTVETAGGIAADAPQREPIAPIMHAADLPALLNELHPGLTIDSLEWRPVHPRAFGRMLRGSLFWPLLLSGAAYLAVQAWALAIFGVLVTLVGIRARLRADYLAWSLTRDAIVVRDGALTHSTRIARFNRVQVPALQRNPFDIRTGMSRIHADTAGARGGLTVPYLPEHTAVELHGELIARTAATEFTW